MKTVEEFGNTVEEAREKAFRALGVRACDEGDVEVEILSEGSPGTSGWGRKLARIRVTLSERRQEGDTPRSILQHILDLMDVDATVEEKEHDGHQLLDIVGPDLAVLIGKHGQTLEALQFILNLIVNRNATERSRILVDVGGYRQRRERSLRELALRTARRAAEEQCPVGLEPMQASERRIIHLALADDPDVETYSQGEEPMRRVIIAPRA